MAVSFYAELPDMSTAQAETVLQKLKLNGRSPKGQILHTEGPLEKGGTWVFDIWESEAAFGAFAQTSLGPIMQELGIAKPNPKMAPARVLLTPEALKHL